MNNIRDFLYDSENQNLMANYHTHTWRCNHAVGTEEEYVQAAIQRGLKTLGFADHSPYCFTGDYYSGFRMKREQLPDYAAVIRGLRDQYRDKLDIHLGVEMEYYPAYFADTIAMLRDNGVEYLILGQHFPGNEIGEQPASTPTEDEDRLSRYCHQVMEGMNTGLFTYLAHPDMFRFVGDPAIYQKHVRGGYASVRHWLSLAYKADRNNESEPYPCPVSAR